MSKEKDFNEILNQCLEALAHGTGIEQCLADHPGEAGELRKLLETASKARLASSLSPRPEFKQRSRVQFRDAAHQAFTVSDKKRLRFHLGWAGSVAIAMVILVSGVSAMAVAAASMPDHALYPVKMATEQSKVNLASTPIKKAEVHVKLADNRVEEIVYVAFKGDPRWVDAIAQRLSDHLDMVAVFAAIRINGQSPSPPAVPAPKAPAPSPAPTPSPKPTVQVPPAKPPAAASARAQVNRETLKVIVQQKAEKNTEKLKDTLVKAPVVVKPNLNKTIDQASSAYQKAIQSIERPVVAGHP